MNSYSVTSIRREKNAWRRSLANFWYSSYSVGLLLKCLFYVFIYLYTKFRDHPSPSQSNFWKVISCLKVASSLSLFSFCKQLAFVLFLRWLGKIRIHRKWPEWKNPHKLFSQSVQCFGSIPNISETTNAISVFKLHPMLTYYLRRPIQWNISLQWKLY